MRDIPKVIDDDGMRVRVVCGEFWGKSGRVEGITSDPLYLDVSIPPRQCKRLPVDRSRHAFAYVFAGSSWFRDASEPRDVQTESVNYPETLGAPDTSNRSLVLFDAGDEVIVQANDEGIRFLLVSGKPLEEPVAWLGAIVCSSMLGEV